MRGLERELDQLFGLPLAEFTPARNELARRLKAADEVDAAAQVRALTKPSVPAWAINQLSRSEPSAVRGLLAAGDAVRKAQKRLLSRAGTADSLRDAVTNEREAIQLLTERAQMILERSGRPATPAVLERIARTLQAAAVDEEGRRSLKTGRLTAELSPAGFEAFSGVQLPTGRESPSAHDELAERRRQRDERQQRKRELQQRVSELERAARDAERDADRAETTAAEARRAAESMRAAADDAAAELAELQ